MEHVKDLNNMYFFAKVVDFGSYTAAAQALGLQTSKLSRRIGALEAELGVRLLNRTTRRLSMTEAGKTFHQHCMALIAEAQAAKDAISQTLESPQGMVRVSCPTGLLQGGLADMLGQFLTAYPKVRINLEATNRRVDIVEEGIDLAIRVRVPPFVDSEMAMRTFGPAEMILVASPQLAKTFGEPQDLKDLGRMPTLSMASAGDTYRWRLQGSNSTSLELTHRPRLSTDDLYTLRQAALQGVGVAYLPGTLVSGDLSTGSLVRLLPELGAQSGVIHAVFPTRKGMVPAVRALLDFLAEGFAAHPWLAEQSVRPPHPLPIGLL